MLAVNLRKFGVHLTVNDLADLARILDFVVSLFLSVACRSG